MKGEEGLVENLPNIRLQQSLGKRGNEGRGGAGGEPTQYFHDLWVGGRWNNDHWYWFHTGEVIQDVGGFPVWAHNFTRPDHDCLNLYRGAKEQAVLFVDRQCNETHGFVCEEALNGEEGLVEELHFRGNTYLFTNMRMTWNDAYDVCASNDSMLPVVFDRETAIFLAEAGRGFILSELIREVTAGDLNSRDGRFAYAYRVCEQHFEPS
uniref:C-type lectin domain-containing protein n=1 Tax=Timema douglasi TaxID=61478 RepID=A0A7R8ZF57_TIMDO|nr:unnamed protein product [Timema douglasi]